MKIKDLTEAIVNQFANFPKSRFQLSDVEIAALIQVDTPFSSVESNFEDERGRLWIEVVVLNEDQDLSAVVGVTVGKDGWGYAEQLSKVVQCTPVPCLHCESTGKSYYNNSRQCIVCNGRGWTLLN